MNRWRTGWLCVALGVFGAGCSSNPCNAVLPNEPTALVWPAAPEQSRVAYVGMLQDNTGCKGVTSASAASLSYPKAIAAGSEGRVYVSDRSGVRVFDTSTGRIEAFANKAPNDVLSSRGLATANDGRLFVSDAERRRILVYGADNTFIAALGADGDMETPQGLAVDSDRMRVYVADSSRHAVLVYGFDGRLIATLKSVGDQVLATPTQVAVNSLGEVFVLHQGEPKVLVFDLQGAIVRKFGEQGVWPGQFVRPKGIAIDSEDHVYVTDSAFDNIQIFDSTGQLLLPLGKAGEGRGEFNLPLLLSIDKRDRIFVAEFGNHRVQVLQYLGQRALGR